MPPAKRAMKPEAAAETDGRKARADESRRRIAQAMLDLLREGERQPSAEVVADRAGVGRRTVFRLFNDMDGVFHEMHAIMLGRLLPIFSAPIDGATWQERLANMIERRARLFEDMLPIKTAADAMRYQTDFLTEQHGEFTAMQRSTLRFVVPKEIQADKPRFEALDLALSFEAWRRLRKEQRLAPKNAAETMHRAAEVLCS